MYSNQLDVCKSIFKQQTKAISTLQQSYGNGLKQLEQTGQAVLKMKQTLTDLQPVLAQSKIDTEEMIVKVSFFLFKNQYIRLISRNQ